MPTINKKSLRGLSTERARRVRQDGHDDAKAFAKAIGMTEYQNDTQAKKDVIDPSGDAHSVKSGQKKWQIFLYRSNRFSNDPGFTVMNGIGDLLVDCINSFPKSYFEYLENKNNYKRNLKIPMQEICKKLQDRKRLKAFFAKSLFNGTEVNYLTIKKNDIYHVFSRDDILDIFSTHLTVENSKARTPLQQDAQKVIFKFQGNNVAELEMRNDSPTHYREIRFNMIRPKAIKLLFQYITLSDHYNHHVIKYGKAIKKFGRWPPNLL